MKMKNVYYLLFLSAIVGYVYDIVLDVVQLSQMNPPGNTSPRLRSTAMNERERVSMISQYSSFSHVLTAVSFIIHWLTLSLLCHFFPACFVCFAVAGRGQDYVDGVYGSTYGCDCLQGIHRRRDSDHVYWDRSVYPDEDRREAFRR